MAHRCEPNPDEANLITARGNVRVNSEPPKAKKLAMMRQLGHAVGMRTCSSFLQITVYLRVSVRLLQNDL